MVKTIWTLGSEQFTPSLELENGGARAGAQDPRGLRLPVKLFRDLEKYSHKPIDMVDMLALRGKYTSHGVVFI